MADGSVEATRRALVEAARDLFSKHGYAGVTIEAIVVSARVTRGALYHHFENKRDLFKTVFGEIEAELVERIRRQMRGQLDPWERLSIGCQAFLDACLDTSIQRIVSSMRPSSWAGRSGALPTRVPRSG